MVDGLAFCRSEIDNNIPNKIPVQYMKGKPPQQSRLWVNQAVPVTGAHIQVAKVY